MKKYVFIFFAALALTACKKEETNIGAPSTISSLVAEPRVGGAVVKWNLPADSNYTYLEISYLKNEKKIITNASKYTDSMLITGLLNKYDYTFEVRPVKNDGNSIAYGEVLTTNTIKPIRRPVQTAYFKVAVTDPLIETYTQESSEGPKKNLVDGIVSGSNYWHSAWSSGVQPLPHWIKVSMPEATNISQFRYIFRQNTTKNGRPTQIALETSEDGTTWNRVWISAEGLPVGAAAVIPTENVLNFDQTYNSKYFRIMFLATQGNTTFVTLSEVAFYRAELTDLELEAEKVY